MPVFSPLIFEAIGIAGFILYVANYAMLTLRVINGHSVIYFAINLAASSAVLIGLSVSFNLAAAMIQIFWVVMSLIGIAIHLRRARTHDTEVGGLT